jgi:hypothetical protein
MGAYCKKLNGGTFVCGQAIRLYEICRGNGDELLHATVLVHAEHGYLDATIGLAPTASMASSAGEVGIDDANIPS